MMRKKTISLIATAALCAASITASADEVWNSNVGEFVYADEQGPTAVWTFGEDDNPGAVFILGLAQVYENRGSYDGYWTRAQSRVKCTTQRMGADKKLTYFWGRFQVKFVDKDFPSRWVAHWSYCNTMTSNGLIKAEPVVASDN